MQFPSLKKSFILKLGTMKILKAAPLHMTQCHHLTKIMNVHLKVVILYHIIYESLKKVFLNVLISNSPFKSMFL